MNNAVTCRREARRLVVDCPAAHPLAGKLVSYGFHFDETTAPPSWWRGYNEAEEARIMEAIAELAQVSPPARAPRRPEANLDRNLVVRGDTYPLRDRLKTEFRCRYTGNEWLAPDRGTAENARIAVALESMNRLGLPRPKDSALYPTPAYILSGKTSPATEEKLHAAGARWLADWGCWSIDGSKEQTLAALAIVSSRKSDATPAMPDEPPLATDAFRMAFYSPLDTIALPKGMNLRLDERPAIVIESGITRSGDGSPHRHWAHLAFTKPSA
jgi:hypothetical protein